MPASPTQIQELVDNSRESLAIELKDWFDPGTPEGQAKVIKSCVAMRKRGDGGFIMVGFDNRSAAPNTSVPFSDVRDRFHSDTINHLVNHQLPQSRRSCRRPAPSSSLPSTGSNPGLESLKI